MNLKIQVIHVHHQLQTLNPLHFHFSLVLFSLVCPVSPDISFIYCFLYLFDISTKLVKSLPEAEEEISQKLGRRLTSPMIIYRMVIVEGRCTKLQLLISYIYNNWLTQKYSEFWLPSYIYDHCPHTTSTQLMLAITVTAAAICFCWKHDCPHQESWYKVGLSEQFPGTEFLCRQWRP